MRRKIRFWILYEKIFYYVKLIELRRFFITVQHLSSSTGNPVRVRLSGTTKPKNERTIKTSTSKQTTNSVKTSKGEVLLS